jgi:hypothetical protein
LRLPGRLSNHSSHSPAVFGQPLSTSISRLNLSGISNATRPPIACFNAATAEIATGVASGRDRGGGMACGAMGSGEIGCGGPVAATGASRVCAGLAKTAMETGAETGATCCSVDGRCAVAFVARLPAIGAMTMLGAQPARTTINANG